MTERLSDDELGELEAELRKMMTWALDEADVRMLQLRQHAYAELRRLREQYRDLSAADARLREELANAQSQLALMRR